MAPRKKSKGGDTVPQKLKLKPEFRAEGKRVEIAWNDKRWRAGVVEKAFKTCFYVKLDKLDKNETNPIKVMAKVGHWRPELPKAASTAKTSKKKKNKATTKEAMCDAPPAKTAAGARQKLKKAAKRLEELKKKR